VFSGTAAYRALLPADEVTDLDLPPFGVWLGPDRHFVHYWVRRGELLNVVAVSRRRRTAARCGWGWGWGDQESWTARAEPGEQLTEFDGWDSRPLASSNARDASSATASTPVPRSRGGTSDA
jgi:salicylate hydroxylase